MASVAVSDDAAAAAGRADGAAPAAAGAPPERECEYEPCATFEGPREGWVFKRGVCGMGYYRDCAPRQIHRIFFMLRNHCGAEALELLGQEPNLWYEVDSDGSTPMHWGALMNTEQLVRAGLAAGVKADVRTSNGQTPLSWAVTKGHVNMAKLLLEAGADLLAKDSLGASPPIIAVQHKQATMLLLFFSLGKQAEVMSVEDKKGCRLLHWASYIGDVASLKILDHFGADFAGAVDGEGKTPLHRAVSNGFNKDVVEFLLDRPVSTTRRDENGKTFLDVAADQHGRVNVERAMKKSLKARGLQQLLEAGGADQICDAERGAVKEVPAAASKKNDFEKMIKYGPAIFWFACVSMTMFEYLIDLRSSSWEKRPFFSVLFELGVPASIALFLYVATQDPGKIAPRPQKLAIEEMTKALATGSWDQAPKLCSETWIVKPPRSKYCRETGRCISEFDHYCGWLGCSIGRGNHRPFILLAYMEVATQLVYIYLGWCGCREFVPYGNSPTEWLLGLAVNYPLLLFVIVIQVGSACLILSLVRMQTMLITWNYTVNEYVNAQRYGYTEITDGQHRIRTSPWDKGGPIANLIDFWWLRRRSEFGPCS